MRRVLDGDTLLLADGRKLRLIGIDTPELGRDGRADAPGARTARAALAAAAGARVGLRYDTERFDRFGRTLGHAYTPGGANLAAALLEQGLAAPIAVPPNLWSQPCYHALAARAAARRAGIWSQPGYRDGIAPGALKRGGFHIVRGRIARIEQDQRGLWLHMHERFRLRLARQDLGYFQGLALGEFTRRNLKVSGWVSRRGQRAEMRLRHPSQIELID